MPEVVCKVEEVYGTIRGKPLNYVERANVDVPFFESLARDKHIVVHGSSKQGKTSLRRNWLGEADFIHVGCLSSMGLPDLNSAILKRAGFSIEQTRLQTTGGQNKYQLKLTGKGKIPWIAEASSEGAVERQTVKTEQVTTKSLEIDLADVNDIIVALKEAQSPKYLVLEDFHYLPIETQVAFSMAMKLFHEESAFCFVVIGVWREKNRLVYFNGDLASRVIAIDADQWSTEQLTAVVKSGEPLLNISFDKKFIEDVVTNAQSAVYLVQEACLKACEAAGVARTGDSNVPVGVGVDAKALIKSVVDEQAGRYTTFIRAVSEGFQPTDLEMYKWLLFAVLDFKHDALASGLRRAEIAAAIKDFHPKGDSLNEGNITQALTNIAALQVKKGVRPIILDYDQTNRVLNVVDRAFLIWLSYQDQQELKSEVIST